jgi:hypothetical protein
MLAIDDYTNKVNVEEWYTNCPIGAMHDADVTSDERRMHALLSLDALTPDESHELDQLQDAFVNELNNQMDQIKF